MSKTNHHPGLSLASGVVGASALTLVHQTAKKVLSSAPRIDDFGSKIIARSLKSVGLRRPSRAKLHSMSLAADMVINSLAYSLVGVGRKRPFLSGTLAGAAMGVVTLLKPNLLGFGKRERGTSLATKAMTMSWYLVGGLVAAAALKLVEDES